MRSFNGRLLSREGGRGSELARGEGALDLATGHWAAHEGHRPSRLKEHAALPRMCVAHHEPPRREALERMREVRRGAIAVRSWARASEAVEDAGAIGVGLKASQKPESGVAERAVVEVHRVLGGDDGAD